VEGLRQERHQCNAIDTPNPLVLHPPTQRPNPKSTAHLQVLFQAREVEQQHGRGGRLGGGVAAPPTVQPHHQRRDALSRWRLCLGCDEHLSHIRGKSETTNSAFQRTDCCQRLNPHPIRTPPPTRTPPSTNPSQQYPPAAQAALRVTRSTAPACAP